MQGSFWTSPVFVVPVIWIIFLGGILWASQPWTHRAEHNPDNGEVGGH